MKRNSIYLYMALLCFVGIILIFVFDGYIGIYDRLEIDNGRFPQTIEADQWQNGRYDYVRFASLERGQRLEFTYTVENHRFSDYATEVAVFFRHNDEDITSPLRQQLTAPAFGEGEVRWVLEADALVPDAYPQEQSYPVEIVIGRDMVKREINVNISGLPAKSVIIEPRPAD